MDGVMTRGECSAVHRGLDYRLDKVDDRLDAHGAQLEHSATIEAQQKEIIKQQDELLKDLNKRVKAMETRGPRRLETIITSGVSTVFGGFLMWLFTRFIK